MGHMPVLSNLSCPILEEASQGADVRLSALKFSSFAEMGEAFRNHSIDAAFIIAPLPLVLRSQGVPAKIVYIGNRHESTLVARKELGLARGQFRLLAGRTVAVPLRFSGHALALRRLLRANRMEESAIRIVEMPPPDMAAALQNGSLDAYFVGEPFAARSVKAGLAGVVEYVEDGWPGFLCNVMIVHDDLIAREPELVRRLVHGAVRASLWAGRNRNQAVAIASRAWGQPNDLLSFAMDTPPGRIVFDRGVPKEAEVRELFDEMVRAGLIDAGKAAVVPDVVDGSFARTATGEGLTADVRSVLPPG
ncbi:MAG: ABC transporter substrate-binding protein [Holophagales bacterium]|nr:ABC transporter substrate-binding protein [Holophagales bacterium]